MTKLLFDEEPLVVQPTLAKLIGLNNAIIVQQLHYWLRTSPHIRDEKPWIYNTYDDWAKQFKFWTADGIKNMIRKLEKEGIVISGNYNPVGFDRTKWYTIDYAKLDAICKQRIEDERQENKPDDQVQRTRRSGTTNLMDDQDEKPSIGYDEPNGEVRNTPPIPEITTETYSENNQRSKPPTTTSADDAKMIWSRCLEQVAKHLSAASFQTWFGQTKGYDYSDKTLTVAVKNEFAKEWIESRYSTFINDALKSLSKGQEIKVKYILLSEGGTGGYEAGPSPI